MNIRVDLNTSIKDGTEVVFRSPVDCSQVTGLKVYYIGADGNTTSQEFMLADAHGNNVGDIDHLFAENVAVKVILDVTTGMAFVQNADTNAYLEGRFASLPIEIADKLCPTLTGSGAVVECEPLEGYPLEAVSSIVPMQSGVPSLENVCPITGHTAVKLWHGGKNFFDVNAVGTYGDIVNNGDGTLTVNKNSRAAKPPHNSLRHYAPELVVGQTYTLSANSTGNYKYIFLSGEYGGVWNFGKSVVMTDAMLNSTVVWYSNGDDTPATVGDIQIELGATATAYEPYRGNEFTMDLGQTVYGGSLDWKTGVLTVDKGFVQLTSDFHMQEYSFVGYAGVTFGDVLAEPLDRANGICSHSPINGTNNSLNMWCGVNGNANIYWLGILDALGLSSIEEFKAWLDTQTVQVCYELATPVTVRLTPQEILALSGVNTLYSDTGDTTVTGKADLAAVVAKLQETLKTLLEG